MGVRKTVGRVLLAAYLVIGVGFAGGCRDLAMANRWVSQKLNAMEEVQPLAVERIDQLRMSVTDAGLVRAELEVIDPEGRRFSFDVSATTMANAASWSSVHAYLGSTNFPVGVPVFAVDGEGIVATDAIPLTPEQRESGLLVFMNEGRENHWFLFAAVPPEGGRPADMVIHNSVLARFALPRPITSASLNRRSAAAVVLYPLAFVIDVITWPAQLVVFMVAMGSISVH